MTPKHTPEPWHLNSTGMTVLDSRGQVIADTAVPEIIGLPDDECRANARLIVEAPKMREALDWFVTGFEPRNGVEAHGLTQIRALLARIDGGDQ